MRALRLIWILVLAFAALPLGYSKGGSGDVYVHGYYRKNGTYVAPYYRSAPNSTKDDNWSTKGNVNPYTGAEGTKNANSPSTPPTVSRPSPAPTTSTPAAVDEKPADAPAKGLTIWDTLRHGMAKEDITKALGEPNIKTDKKWGYGNGGWITFDDKGLVDTVIAPKNS